MLQNTRISHKCSLFFGLEDTTQCLVLVLHAFVTKCNLFRLMGYLLVVSDISIVPNIEHLVIFGHPSSLSFSKIIVFYILTCIFTLLFHQNI